MDRTGPRPRTQRTREVGLLLGIGLVIIPSLLVWILLRKGYSRRARAFGFTSFAGHMLFGLWSVTR